MKKKLEAAQRAHDEACVRHDAAVQTIRDMPDDADEEAITAAEAEFDEAEAEKNRTGASLDRVQRIIRAREQNPPLVPDTPDAPEPIQVTRDEPVYRPDTGPSFFGDLYRAQRYHDRAAAERLDRNQMQALEKRVVTSADPGAAGFIPPIYLGEYWAELPRAGRPFADKVPTFPFPDTGLTVTVPKVQTGVTEAVQASENSAVSSTDIDTQTVTASLVTIAGQNDISRQALERAFPGMDVIIYRDLLAAYNVQLDTQCLAGTGSSGQHRGIRAVSGAISVPYTDATPTGAELIPKIYDAIQQVASNRFMNADLIVMHPRRASWLAKEFSSTFPLFAQGGMVQTVGTQAEGFAGMMAGLPVLQDANIGTTYGAGTNEDEIYVLHTGDLLLAEGAIRQATYEDVLSANLVVRLQLFAYSFFVPHRQAKSIAIISGTGLVTPTF